MVFTRCVQDPRVLVCRRIRPLLVHRPGVVVHRPVDRQQAEGDDGLLVDNVDLIGDSGDAQPGTGGQNGGFGDETVARQGIENGLRCIFRVFGGNGGRLGGRVGEFGAAGSEGGRGGEGGAKECWAGGADGAWESVSVGTVSGWSVVTKMRTHGAFCQ